MRVRVFWCMRMYYYIMHTIRRLCARFRRSYIMSSRCRSESANRPGDLIEEYPRVSSYHTYFSGTPRRNNAVVSFVSALIQFL